MKREDLRKVIINLENGTTLNGYFHQWVTDNTGHVFRVMAIVELEDGSVGLVKLSNLRIIDC